MAEAGKAPVFTAEDGRVFLIADPAGRAASLRTRILPRLRALLDGCLASAVAAGLPDWRADSLISTSPNPRPARSGLGTLPLYDAAFAGLGGRRRAGHWPGLARARGGPAVIPPFRLGFTFDADGIGLEFTTMWLGGLSEESYAAPLNILLSKLAELEPILAEEGIVLSCAGDDREPSEDIAAGLRRAITSRDFDLCLCAHFDFDGTREEMGQAFSALYRVYCLFIEAAKNASFAHAAVAEPVLHRAIAPATQGRAAVVPHPGPAETYALALQGASILAVKIGWAFDHLARCREFNMAAMPSLGGIAYAPLRHRAWPSAEQAFAMEQAILRRFAAHRHPANGEIIVGISTDELLAAWDEAAMRVTASG